MISRGAHYVGWRRWVIRLLGAFALVLVVAAFLPLWQTDTWWVRMLDYPRMQLGFIGLFVAIVYAFVVPQWRRGRSLFVLSTLAIATIWQFAHSARFIFLYPEEVATAQNCPADRRVSMVGANVLITNDDYAAHLGVIEKADADLVLLTESDAAWEQAMKPIEARYPYRVAVPLENSYGMHLYSKLRFDGAVKYRVQDDIPSIDGKLRLRDGSDVHLFAIHPEPPRPGDDTGERDAELVLVGREVRDNGGASIVLGDLNDVAWSKTTTLFEQVSGTKDPRVGRQLMPTFNATWPLMRWPLDHLFLSPHWDLIDMERLGAGGSDHFAVRFDICLARDPDKRMVAPSADEDAEQEASEQLDEGLEETATEVDGEKY